MDKNTTIAFVLIGIILVVWLYMNAPEPQPPTGTDTDTTLVQEKIDTFKDREIEKTEVVEKLDEEESVQDLVFAQTGEEEQIITINTDLVRLELTSKGARIKKYYLKEYNSWYNSDLPENAPFHQQYVQLINYKNNGGDFNLLFVTKEGKLVNSAKLDFQTDAYNYEYTLTGEDSVIIEYVYTAGDFQIIRKRFIIYGNNYASKIDVELENMDDVISSYRYDVVWSNGINFVEENSVDEGTYANASAFSGDEQVIVDASSVDEKEVKDINGLVDWIGVRNKYFTIILSPDNPSQEGGAYFEGEKVVIPGLGEREYYSSSLKIPFQDTRFQKNSFELYIGPVEYDILKSYNKKYESVFDFGSFLGLKFVTRPISEYILLPLFKFLHTFIPNFGFVIIIFSLIIKIVLYPLTRQSYKSMKKMQMLQPKIAELKAKYKDEPQKVQKETMKLYRTYGINPAGGCLPLLLQMPILFALFSFFRVAIEIRQQPFILWMTDLSAPDVIYDLGFKIPLFGISEITGLAPLLGISMFFQQKMSVKDPSQKALVYVMPFMFTFMFMGFSSGLNLYYLMFNVFSIAQQYYINHQKGDGELVPVKNPKKKKGGGFMQRMMEAAEKQSQAQKKAQKKKR